MRANKLELHCTSSKQLSRDHWLVQAHSDSFFTVCLIAVFCPVPQATGIMEMRQALEEKEDAKSLKQKTRERVRPKMGKLTIDYQKLHDAFFRSH